MGASFAVLIAEEGIAAVEMEAAALYALASATGYPIVCFAPVTNSMATAGDDFEKGPDQGSQAILAIPGEGAHRLRGARLAPNDP